MNITNVSGLAALKKHPPTGGGGGAAWNVVAHTFGNGTGSGTTTSPGINTTGANLIVAQVEGGTFSTFTDSKGNTWTPLNDPSFNPHNAFYYCISPTTDASHTFSVSSGRSCSVIALTKSGGTPQFDSQGAGEAGNYYSGQSLVPGSLTPATSTDIMISSIIFDTQASTSGASINSSYTTAESNHSTGGMNLILAYKIKSDSIAENPTWAATWAFGPGGNANHACFK